MWRIRIIPTIATLTVACTLVTSAFAQDTPSPNPTPVQPSPVPTSTPAPTPAPAPKVELDEIFYSNPRRLGSAAQMNEQMQAPEAGLISLNRVEGEYLVEVVAGPGAVPPNARVLLVNMETLFFKLVTADDQGAFRQTVLGFPGGHILIKQDSTGTLTVFDSVENMAHAEFILAPGNSTDRAEAYRQFRGRDPEVTALLVKLGFPTDE